MRLVFTSVCALALLSACTTTPEWHDLTGANRRNDAAHADLSSCEVATHFPTGDTSNLTNDALDDAMVGLRHCMRDRGWEPVPGNSN
jgi:hypothetical protein